MGGGGRDVAGGGAVITRCADDEERVDIRISSYKSSAIFFSPSSPSSLLAEVHFP